MGCGRLSPGCEYNASTWAILMKLFHKQVAMIVAFNLFFGWGWIGVPWLYVCLNLPNALAIRRN